MQKTAFCQNLSSLLAQMMLHMPGDWLIHRDRCQPDFLCRRANCIMDQIFSTHLEGMKSAHVSNRSIEHRALICSWEGRCATSWGCSSPCLWIFKDDTTGCGVFGFLRICRKATCGGKKLSVAVSGDLTAKSLGKVIYIPPPESKMALQKSWLEHDFPFEPVPF